MRTLRERAAAALAAAREKTIREAFDQKVLEEKNLRIGLVNSLKMCFGVEVDAKDVEIQKGDNSSLAVIAIDDGGSPLHFAWGFAWGKVNGDGRLFLVFPCNGTPDFGYCGNAADLIQITTLHSLGRALEEPHETRCKACHKDAIAAAAHDPEEDRGGRASTRLNP